MDAHAYSNIDFVLGVIFILFYAGQRFNTPSTNRSSTTAGRYFASLFLYCLVGIAAYVVLVKFPHLMAFLLKDNKDAVPGWASELSSPLLIALLLTVLLPKLPFLSNIDQWICQQLQNVAAIPWEVRRLSAELRNDKLELSADEQSLIRQQLQDDGFDPRDIVFGPPSSPASMWTQLTSLLQKVSDWESDRRMASYLAISTGELEKLRRRHQTLCSKAKTCFHLLREDGDNTGSTKTHEAVLRYREDFTDQVSHLTHDTFDFIARGVLYAELTDRARENRLKALGFTIDWPGPTFSLNQMMLLFAVVCIVMLSGFVLFADTIRGLSFGLILTRAVMISVIYSVAVACAVLPRERWSFARARVGDVRPVAFYIVAGLMASAISFATSLCFNSILLRSFVCGFQRSELTYPWALITFTTALVTAALVDNPHFSFVSRWQQRCLEGAAQATVMFGVAYVTYQWLLQLSQNIGPTSCNLSYQMPPKLTIIVMAGVVGFVIGFFIPTWYRRHVEMTQEEVRSVPASQPDPGPSAISI